MGLSDVGRGMEACGVSRAAIASSLASEGHTEMREFVMEGLYEVDPDYDTFTCINVYGQKNTDPSALRLAFNLLAKELHLSRAEVRVMDLQTLIGILRGDNERWVQADLMALDMLFVTDFYEDGAPYPLDAYDSMLLRAFIRRFVEECSGFCSMTDIPLVKCTKWYPQNFLTYLANKSIQFKVGAE